MPDGIGNPDSTWIARSDLEAEVLNILAGSEEFATVVELSDHAADTTNVHGIANTANLASKTEVNLKADVEDLIDHEADTKSVHGIADTSRLTADTAATLFYASLAGDNTFEFRENQSPEEAERITVVEESPYGKVLQFEFQAGDEEVAGGNRSELVSGTEFGPGEEIWISMKIKRIEGDWSKWQISWQMHDDGSGSPPVSLQYLESGGTKYIWFGPGDASTEYARIALSGAGNQWIDLLFRIKIHATEGEFEVWKDGVLQSVFGGGTTRTGLNTEGEAPLYDKCGIYRSSSAVGTTKVRITRYTILRKLRP